MALTVIPALIPVDRNRVFSFVDNRCLKQFQCRAFHLSRLHGNAALNQRYFSQLYLIPLKHFEIQRMFDEHWSRLPVLFRQVAVLTSRAIKYC